MRRAVIRVGEPVVRDRMVTVAVDVDGPRRFTRLVREAYWTEYDIDVSGVPPSILSVPVVSSLLPLAWACAADLEIAVLDATYASAIPRMRRAWSGVYRGFDEGGQHTVGRLEDARPHLERSSSVVLFSGGVDSTASVLAHRDEAVTLCPVWGIDVPSSSSASWGPMEEHLRRFARDHGVGVSVVRSNVRRFLDERLLDARFRDRLTQWWRASVGLVLPAVAAPIAWHAGASVVRMPATHDSAYDAPYGSTPAIDESIEVAGIRVEHDGFDRSRHEKLAAIAVAAPDQVLLVCRSGAARGIGNCSRCEKCLRTIAAMVSLGIDPGHHGLVLDEGTAPALEHLVDSGVLGSADTPYFWRRVAAGVPDAVEGAGPDGERLLDVVRALDVDGLWRRGRRPPRLRARRLVGRVIPHRLRPLARRIYLRTFRHW